MNQSHCRKVVKAMRQRRAIPDQGRHRGEPLRGPSGGIDSDQFVPNLRGSTFPWSVAVLCGAVVLAFILLAIIAERLGL